MKSLTIEELRALMSDILDEPVDLRPGFESVSFSDLGYDSLAVLAINALLVERYAVHLPSAVFRRVQTPSELLNCINSTFHPGGSVVQ